jgi:hypothetical protein
MARPWTIVHDETVSCATQLAPDLVTPFPEWAKVLGNITRAAAKQLGVNPVSTQTYLSKNAHASCWLHPVSLCSCTLLGMPLAHGWLNDGAYTSAGLLNQGSLAQDAGV